MLHKSQMAGDKGWKCVKLVNVSAGKVLHLNSKLALKTFVVTSKYSHKLNQWKISPKKIIDKTTQALLLTGFNTFRLYCIYNLSSKDNVSRFFSFLLGFHDYSENFQTMPWRWNEREWNHVENYPKTQPTEHPWIKVQRQIFVCNWRNIKKKSVVRNSLVF